MSKLLGLVNTLLILLITGAIAWFVIQWVAKGPGHALMKAYRHDQHTLQKSRPSVERLNRIEHRSRR